MSDKLLDTTRGIWHRLLRKQYGVKLTDSQIKKSIYRQPFHSEWARKGQVVINAEVGYIPGAYTEDGQELLEAASEILSARSGGRLFIEPYNDFFFVVERT